MIRVLVVDDDFMVARIHSGYVSRVEGFEVVATAHSGAEALRAVQQHQPDLVLLDIYLPDMDGLSVLRAPRPRRSARIRSRPRARRRAGAGTRPGGG